MRVISNINHSNSLFSKFQEYLDKHNNNQKEELLAKN